MYNNLFFYFVDIFTHFKHLKFYLFVYTQYQYLHPNHIYIHDPMAILHHRGHVKMTSRLGIWTPGPCNLCPTAMPRWKLWNTTNEKKKQKKNKIIIIEKCQKHNFC